MNVFFEKKFLKEISSLSDKKLRHSIERIIVSVENAPDLSSIPNLKKLKGGKTAYRIRVGDYRIGIDFDGTRFVFVRFMHRRDIYNYFP